MNEKTGRNLRLKRLYRYNGEHLLVVPLDHTVFDGPFSSNADYEKTLEDIADAGADAVILHKGRLRGLSENFYRKISVITHISSSTKYATDVDEKYIVANVEDAVRRGADGISVHVNLGSQTEAQQLQDLAEVAESCEKFGVPLLAMMYTRGQRISEHSFSATQAHAATLATDLGADIVKLALPNDIEQIKWIRARCPVPVIAAGGAKLDEPSFLEFVHRVISGGCAGMAAGRNIFMSKDVKAIIKNTRNCFNQQTPFELQI